MRGEKKGTRCLSMFLIALFAIIIDESVDTILIESIIPIAQTHGWLDGAFLVSSMPCALLMAGWSDFHCRRKTLIVALISIFISGVLMMCYNQYGAIWMAFASLSFKAILGNAIPVSLASLLDIMPSSRLRNSLAIAICGISLGSWVPIYFRSSLFLFLNITTILTIVCIGVVILWFKDSPFDGIKLSRNPASFGNFLYFLKKDFINIFSFLTIPIVALFFLGFTISEASFYQILLRGEFLQHNDYFSFSSVALGIGYYFGTALLFVFGFKRAVKFFNDKVCIKLGLMVSFFAILLIFILDSTMIMEGGITHLILISGFSVGFSLFIPSLFSFLSKNRKNTDQGKIYGLLESTDSLSVAASALFIKKFKTIPHNFVSMISLILFCFSTMLMLYFFKLVKKLENREESRS